MVDVFAGENTGLVLAEVELDRADQPVDLPPWAGREVTDDPRYLNINLARHPYRLWGPNDRRHGRINYPRLRERLTKGSQSDPFRCRGSEATG